MSDEEWAFVAPYLTLMHEQAPQHDYPLREVFNAFVDQGYTGEKAQQAAAQEGIQLEVVKLEQAKHGFVLLPRRWVVARSFAWMSWFRRLARDYERLAETLAGLHFVAFAILMLSRFAQLDNIVHNTF